MANWLYNGVELPDIHTVWDQETYPYAVIRPSGANLYPYYLCVTSTKPEVTDAGVYDADSDGEMKCVVYTCDSADAGWNASGSGDDGPRYRSSYGNTTTWVSFDAYNADGTLYMAASEPILVGSKLTITTGSANGDGMALYNGVVLPTIDSVWTDRETYPYAFLDDMSEVWPSTFGLTFSTTQLGYDGSAAELPDNSSFVQYECTFDSSLASSFGIATGEWIFNGEDKGALRPYKAIWTSTDVVSSTDGSVYLAASDPVSLDGMNVIQWDGSTDGLASFLYTFNFCKVSDDTPSADELAGAICAGKILGENGAMAIASIEDTGTGRIHGYDTDGALTFIVFADGNRDGAEAGIYFLSIPEWGVYTSILAYHAASASVTDTTATVGFTCSDLNETDRVYRVKAWVYKKADGLDTALPASWTSELFTGPSHSERHTFTGLTPGTEYEVYAVIWLENEGAASEHNAAAAFTTLEGEAVPVLGVMAKQVRDDGFTLSITRSGLEADTEYTAEVIVYKPDTSAVAAEKVITFTGDGTVDCIITGLEPATEYAVSVDVYPSPAGEIVVRGDYTVTTTEQKDWGIYVGVAGVARPVCQVYIGVNGVARRVKGVYIGVNGVARPITGG